MKTVNEIAEEIKEFAKVTDKGDYVVVVIVANTKTLQGDLKVLGVNKYSEALPILNMAKGICRTFDNHPKQGMVLEDGRKIDGKGNG